MRGLHNDSNGWARYSHETKVMCETPCCNDPETYFFNLVFLGLEAIKSVKVENVSSYILGS